MPFEQGNQLAKGHGRKGYEIEQEQLETMIKMLSKYLIVIDKILDDKAEDKDYTKLEKVGADMRKIFDKLHASREKSNIEISLSDNLIDLFRNAADQTADN